MLVQVENEDGTWSTLNRGAPGEPPQELAVLAERWRASLVFGTARIRVTERQAERWPPDLAARSRQG